MFYEAVKSKQSDGYIVRGFMESGQVSSAQPNERMQKKETGSMKTYGWNN